MSEPEGIELSDQNPVEPGTAEPRHAAPPRPRAIGSPLPMGVSRRQQLSPEQGDVDVSRRRRLPAALSAVERPLKSLPSACSAS